MSSPNPPQRPSSSDSFHQLRLDAEARLEAGASGPSNGWSLSPDALTRLHRLASTPDSAGDALKLLHELQTHQVELDIQHEQLQASEHQAIQDLLFYRTLFHSAPVGYFITGLDGHIMDCNPAACKLIGLSGDELSGRKLESFVAPRNQSRIAEFFRQSAHNSEPGSLAFHPEEGSESDGMPWQLHGQIAPSGEAILVTLSRQDNPDKA